MKKYLLILLLFIVTQPFFAQDPFGLTTQGYATLASPTFTGTVTLPSTTSIGTVSSTEIGYLDNVTSAIQTQFTGKASLSGAIFTGSISMSGTTIAFTPSKLTDAERDAMSTTWDGTYNGAIIYNTTTDKLQVWVSPAWVDLH